GLLGVWVVGFVGLVVCGGVRFVLRWCFRVCVVWGCVGWGGCWCGGCGGWLVCVGWFWWLWFCVCWCGCLSLFVVSGCATAGAWVWWLCVRACG
ncbi:hypothetical protein, partial [Pseudomonas syringae group genomosp. 7]|uniref:hypothetical protein n=1 Tax=Pseudomonas syringae group genomosp. 7 TaxID=251699 RepID=UPI0037705834